MATDVMEQLLELFAEVVGEPAAHGPDTVRADMDTWDSLAQVRLVYAVERAFAVELPESTLTSEPTLAELAAAVVTARRERVS
ncbi:acyl carrier protein [Nocardia brasiliensis]|nr:acyl carrier protein [Nocardia brasiliensis]MBF6130917.1 acyl carrier protein [Nocardia brasiliensis]MBF6548180.1 acyl carrier protein [Nocardia brasiliensis]